MTISMVHHILAYHTATWTTTTEHKLYQHKNINKSSTLLSLNDPVLINSEKLGPPDKGQLPAKMT